MSIPTRRIRSLSSPMEHGCSAYNGPEAAMPVMEEALLYKYLGVDAVPITSTLKIDEFINAVSFFSRPSAASI